MNFLELVGATCVGIILLGVLLIVLTVGQWTLGHIIGAFNYRRHGNIWPDAKWHQLVRLGFRWTWEAMTTGGGWYQHSEKDGSKIYHYAFHRSDEAD